MFNSYFLIVDSLEILIWQNIKFLSFVKRNDPMFFGKPSSGWENFLYQTSPLEITL